MASRNKDERAHVNALVKAIQKNSPGVYVYIDRDAGAARHTSSGFDFLMVLDGRVIFCEAKILKGALSDWQQFIKTLIETSNTAYRVIRFLNNENFSIDDKKIIAIKSAKYQDFL